jgi:hypothetical protein
LATDTGEGRLYPTIICQCFCKWSRY